MAIVFGKNHKPATGLRLTGFARYTEVLGRSIKAFLVVNLLTLAGFLPFFTGLVYALLSSSLLLLIPFSILGGLIAGPFLAAMYDCIFRSLRDASGKIFSDYKRAWKQNWKTSLLPGAICCLMIGVYSFMILLFYWAERFPGWGTIAVMLLGMLIFFMFFSIFWPLTVLFESTMKTRALQTLLFIIPVFWKVAGIAFLQLLYWFVIVMLLPWSSFLLLLMGFWFILYTASFIIYNFLNQTFSIEERIAEEFPEQAPFYETDEMWLQRKSAGTSPDDVLK